MRVRAVAFGVITAIIIDAVTAVAGAVPYDIVYVRQPRFGDNNNTTWPEIFHPASIDPGADLMLLHPNGSEEVLVDGGNGSVTDPFVSFDAQWVYYSYFPDMRASAINSQRGLPYEGADIYRIHLATRTIERLTFGEFTPNTGAAHWYQSPDGAYQPIDTPNQYAWDHLGYGILNLGPAPIAGGKIAFTSNRNGFLPPKGFTNPTLQLFVMDEDGSNVTQIAPLNISAALHPTPMRDGRLMFSTHESQGLRDSRLWGIWSIYPDGRRWAPVVSAFRGPQAFHFMTQLSNEDIVVVDYYNLNNNGFGALYRLPVRPPAGTPAFHSAFPEDNPSIDQTIGQGFLYPFTMPFTPWGMFSITPFTHGLDEAAPVGAGGVRVGKFTHPSAAPNNDLLVVWTPGPANDLNRPTTIPYYDAGLYLMPGGDIADSPNDLVLIKNNSNYNEAWPRAVVRYDAVHGVAEPDELPWLPNDGVEHPAQLPAGTPYGLIGTSGFYKRESFPGWVVPWSNTFDGLDVFNTTENEQSSNWSTQGSDAGKYNNSDIWAVRLISMEPGTHRSYGPNGGPSGEQLFDSHAGERLRILGEIPLRKFNGGGQPILDPEGNPDTSFLARVVADTPFTFQTLDRNGLVLNMAQTWHQVRPGEARFDCGGCHAHSQQPLAFEDTYADRPDYPVADLTQVTPLLTHDAGGQPSLRTVNSPAVNVEFYADIRPLLVRSCVPCHTKNNPTPPGSLVLDDYNSLNGFPGDYARLAADQNAQFGYKPLVNVGGPRWRQSNASRYVRMFQSRRSLLMWKIFGQRLDGWSNADHPTESVPGNASTLPPGAEINEADLDYTGTIMPPTGSGVPSLTIDEKMTFARWIDLGCPINWGSNGTTPWGWFLDEIRPTVALTVPPPGRSDGPLSQIFIGVGDAYTGLDLPTLSVTANFGVNGRNAGEELVGLLEEQGGGVYRLQLDDPLTMLDGGELTVVIADNQGNINKVVRSFSIGAPVSPCAAQPSTACTLATRSSLALADRGATRDRLMWRWFGDDPTAPGAFGNPTTATGYTLCIYDTIAGAPQLAAQFALPPGSHWSQRNSGFAYRDRDGISDGITSARLSAGASGLARLAIGGRGALSLPPPAPSGGMFAQDPEVRAQLVADNGNCWEASYFDARTNRSDMFVGR